MKGKNISLALLALMMSKPALALDFEYHTRAGFSAIVNAFTGASLMFNDKLWMTLLFVVVVLGCMVAAGSNVWQTMTNIGSNDNKALSLNWLMALFLGSAVMVGLVFPKSRMYIYDDVTNQTYTVGNVPLLVGFLAGGFNSAQTGFSTLIRRNRGTVQDSTKFADGLMLNLMNTSLDKTLLYRIDPDLEINIKEYYNKCVEPAKSLNYVSHKELKQTTNDILSVFGKAKTDHWYMEWNGTAAAGQSRFSTVSCSDAYSRIKTALTPNSPTMNALTESICSKNHFSPTKAVAFQACKSKLDETARGVFNSSSNGSKMIVNGILANSIRESLMDRNVRTIADRNMVQDGIVSFDTTSLWIDNIKANFIVIILALSPLVALLIPTIIGGRALKLLVAMWLFIFIWGVCDDMLYYAALDQAAVALEDLDSMSVSSMWTAPNDALKALAILGESRSSAMQLSVMVCSMLFGISAYALGGIAQRSMSNVDQNSDKISEEMKTENVGGAMDNVTSSLTAQAIHDEHGIGEMSNAGIYDRQSNLGRASSAIDLRGGEAMGAGWADGSASGVESNRQAQATEKNIDAAGGAENYTASASSVDSGNVMGNIQAVSDAANDNGISIGQQATNTSHTQGTEQQVNAEKTQELVDALSEGNGVSNHAAHKQKVDVDRASETANVEVYQGNDQTPVSTSSISKQHGDADAAKTGELATQVGGMDNLVDLNRAEQQAKANIYGADSQDAVFTSQTQQEHGQAQAKLLDERAGKYGGMDEVVKADNANSLAQDEAYEHDASRAVTDKTNQQTESVARNEQKYSELSSNDINPAQSGVTQGTIDAAHIAGQKEGLEVVGSDAVQAQSAVNTVRGASAGQAALDAQDDGLQGVKDTQSTLTEHESLTQQADADKWNYLTDTLGLDKEQIAQAESGANMHWAVTPDMANDLLEKGVISSRQAEFINDNDGGRLDFSMGKEGEGFAISTSKAATGDSLSADNSTHESDAVTQDTSYNFASTEAANDFLHDAKAIQNAYEYVDGDEAEFSRIVANAGEKVMSNYYSSTEQETGTFSTEGGASIGNKGGGIFGISAGMHASHDEQNIESINAHTADYLQAPRRFAQEAEAKGLKGDEREEYIADKIVSFHANKENEAQDKVLRDKDPSSETEVAELRPEIVNAGSAWGAAGYKDFESRQPRSLTDYSDGANDNKGDKQEVPGGEHSSRGAQADAGQPQQVEQTNSQVEQVTPQSVATSDVTQADAGQPQQVEQTNSQVEQVTPQSVATPDVTQADAGQPQQVEQTNSQVDQVTPQSVATPDVTQADAGQPQQVEQTNSQVEQVTPQSVATPDVTQADAGQPQQVEQTNSQVEQVTPQSVATPDVTQADAGQPQQVEQTNSQVEQVTPQSVATPDVTQADAGQPQQVEQTNSQVEQVTPQSVATPDITQADAGQSQQVEQSNSQVEQVTLQSEHVLGEGIELQQITEQTEVKQLQEFTHEEITNISPVSRVTEGGATSGSAEQPTSVETQAVEQPTSVETQAVEQPASVETQAVEQPTSVETQAVEQPTSVETQAVEQPTSVETQAVEQPTSVETQAVEQPTSVETQAVEQPTQTIVEKENGAINEQVVNDGQVTIVKKVGSDEDGEDLKDVERGLANSDLPPSERHKESEQGL